MFGKVVWRLENTKSLKKVALYTSVAQYLVLLSGTKLSETAGCMFSITKLPFISTGDDGLNFERTLFRKSETTFSES